MLRVEPEQWNRAAIMRARGSEQVPSEQRRDRAQQEGDVGQHFVGKAHEPRVHAHAAHDADRDPLRVIPCDELIDQQQCEQRHADHEQQWNDGTENVLAENLDDRISLVGPRVSKMLARRDGGLCRRRGWRRPHRAVADPSFEDGDLGMAAAVGWDAVVATLPSAR